MIVLSLCPLFDLMGHARSISFGGPNEVLQIDVPLAARLAQTETYCRERVTTIQKKYSVRNSAQPL
jgi:hypothetical protein